MSNKKIMVIGHANVDVLARRWILTGSLPVPCPWIIS